MEKQNSEVSAYIHGVECLSSGNNEVTVLLNYFSLFLEFLECFQLYHSLRDTFLIKKIGKMKLKWAENPTVLFREKLTRSTIVTYV